MYGSIRRSRLGTGVGVPTPLPVCAAQTSTRVNRTVAAPSFLHPATIFAGGHGFGLRKQGTSSDHWIDELYYWLAAQGFTRVAAKVDDNS